MSPGQRSACARVRRSRSAAASGQARRAPPRADDSRSANEFAEEPWLIAKPGAPDALPPAESFDLPRRLQSEPPVRSFAEPRRKRLGDAAFDDPDVPALSRPGMFLLRPLASRPKLLALLAPATERISVAALGTGCPVESSRMGDTGSEEKGVASDGVICAESSRVESRLAPAALALSEFRDESHFVPLRPLSQASALGRLEDERCDTTARPSREYRERRSSRFASDDFEPKGQPLVLARVGAPALVGSMPSDAREEAPARCAASASMPSLAPALLGDLPLPHSFEERN